MAKLRGLVLAGVLGAVLFTASPAFAEPMRPATVTVTVAHASVALRRGRNGIALFFGKSTRWITGCPNDRRAGLVPRRSYLLPPFKP